MGVVKLDAYVLILRGKDSLKLIDGLSTNKVDGNCTTIFTTSVAKIIDVVDVVDKGEFVALVGHGPFKEAMIANINQRILGQDVVVGDATASNQVFISTKDIDVADNVTKILSFKVWKIIAPNGNNIEVDMSMQEYDEFRVDNLIPFQGNEITAKVHPLSCGLGDLVHEAKGCYIGQEILARMRSRGRKGKQLVRIANPIEDATTIGKTHSLAIRRV
tara:strand:- start:216 stop:866 length:651 start_codon:yes stop_codon:yes gene_type:complete